MELDGGIYVSENVRREEFLRLNLEKIDGIRPNIELAIHIFRDRIQGRYLYQIEDLNKNAFYNGFASMALCCLLIDTFYQFEHGIEQTDNNKKCYKDFLMNQMGDIFDTNEKAERFYKDIRCGILHSAQTKGGSRLSCDQEEIVKMFRVNNKYRISVNVKKIGDALFDYFDRYCERVRTDNDTQDNFVKKMQMLFK